MGTVTRRSAASELLAQGQSVWLDFITRDLVRSGELRRMIEVEGLRGETSNPTIFEKAITSGTSYDDGIRLLSRRFDDAAKVLDALAIEDIREACDLFRPLYDQTGGRDGFVSIEVAPELATDAQASIDDARRLWASVDRPNVMVKVPGTDECVPAVEQLLFEGINVNITLLFSTAHHARVMEAYLRALERRLADGAPIDRIASVASFFVSRVDTLVDGLLTDRMTLAAPQDAERMAALVGKIGIANARCAYANFREVFDGERFARLAAKGARLQRPLWASTSTKNPAYPELLYVESLIGPDTVCTMPLATLRALEAHGVVERKLDLELVEARRLVSELRAVGVGYDSLTTQLENEGIAAFDRSHRAAIKAVRAKVEAARTRKEDAMLCQDVMKSEVHCLSPDDNIASAAALMRDANVGFLPICSDDGRVIGTITDRDIVVRAIARKQGLNTTVRSVMSRESIIACRPQDDLAEAERRMARAQVSRILCIDDDFKLRGVISLSDVAKRDRARAGETLGAVAHREAHA